MLLWKISLNIRDVTSHLVQLFLPSVTKYVKDSRKLNTDIKKIKFKSVYIEFYLIFIRQLKF